jgi:8-oxo-dGTP diphosphatase
MGRLRFHDIDWSHWSPQDEATLLFVILGRQVLLIDKQRGLGAGKINGPGGRVEDGETPYDAAVREVQEELCVTPLDVKKAGELSFQFTDGYSLRCHVFSASDIDGEPVATSEAVPRWESIGNLPFDRMWADDRIWLPMLLAGQQFRGAALFEGDQMLGHDIRPVLGRKLWN